METVQKDELSLGSPHEGLLCKYTNMVKGWQNRWFVIDVAQGLLEYHEREEYKNQRPRGFLPLAGALVAPSEEDSVTFTVHSTLGEVYRLKANDAKSRQIWVNHLRYVAEEHEKRTDRPQQPAARHESQRSSIAHTAAEAAPAAPSADDEDVLDFRPLPFTALETSFEEDPVRALQKLVHDIYEHEGKLLSTIESLPVGGLITPLDRDLLLLKASSKSAVGCIEHCLHILQAHQSTGHVHRDLSPPRRKQRQSTSGSSNVVPEQLLPAVAQEESIASDALSDFNEEVEDAEECPENDLGTIEEHKSIVLQVLSQLKFGMDLTKVVLPTFILEKKSLLEMFADCMCHGQLFVSIARQPSAEERMLQVLIWYLTAFHRTKLGSIAKKPYNPIIGETFACSWLVPENESRGSWRVRYCAEQVSHHPPVSAFYMECPEAQTCLSTSLWTKSKYMGMAIGVNLIGSMILSLASLHEDYILTLPSAYARSILSHPFVELGDRVCITCKETGYNAAIVFHTKPFYGGKLHRITGEVKSSEGAVVYRVAGEWNGTMEITNSNGAVVKSVVCDSLPVLRKRVAPPHLQKDYESRKLWAAVTDSLREGNMEQATYYKSRLEDMQREEEKDRVQYGLPHYAKYFEKLGDSWFFKDAMSLPEGTLPAGSG